MGVDVGPGVRVKVRVNVGPGRVFVKVGEAVIDFLVGVKDLKMVAVLLAVGICVVPGRARVDV